MSSDVDVGSIVWNGFEVESVQYADVRSGHRLGQNLHLTFTLKHSLA